MRKKVLAANWKMNGSLKALDSYLSSLSQVSSDGDVEVILALPSLYLPEAQKLLKGQNLLGIKLAAQNAHQKDSGAFTGEQSFSMLKEFGVSHCILGHSERRQYFGESNEGLSEKVAAAIRSGLTPILCVGESLEERQSGKLESVLKLQIESALSRCSDPEKIVIAYEPIWAIGTGVSASSDEANDAHKFVRQLLSNRFTKESADKVSILYGGSMKASNTAELIAMSDIDGGLVGGASLKADEFGEMIRMVGKS